MNLLRKLLTWTRCRTARNTPPKMALEPSQPIVPLPPPLRGSQPMPDLAETQKRVAEIKATIHSNEVDVCDAPWSALSYPGRSIRRLIAVEPYLAENDERERSIREENERLRNAVNWKG